MRMRCDGVNKALSTPHWWFLTLLIIYGVDDLAGLIQRRHPGGTDIKVT